jgi:hypothetical protein
VLDLMPPPLAQPPRKRRRQLSIDEELHSAASTIGWLACAAA